MPEKDSTERPRRGRPKGSRNRKPRKPQTQTTATGSSSSSRPKGEDASSQRSEIPSQDESSTQLRALTPLKQTQKPSYRGRRKPDPTDWDSKRGGTIGCSVGGQTGAEGTNSEAQPNTFDPAQPGISNYGSTRNDCPTDSRALMNPNQHSSVDQNAQNQQESAGTTQYNSKVCFGDVRWNPHDPLEQ
ncbi:uncharacterized protein L203_105076 [Cryptococcus depauperatus CBS 7841]|uniref:Uncharacterized protein n=1 Tax=Cryptococcus depauperatus CBS 7841 TaxID=1295531 RepID=A0AAJ8JWS8_9TREE